MPVEVRITVKDKETKTTVTIHATVPKEGGAKLMKDAMELQETWRKRSAKETLDGGAFE